MSMDLRFEELFDTMNGIEEMTGEFGREPAMNIYGFRGSYVETRPRTGDGTRKLRKNASGDIPNSDGVAVNDPECDDYDCSTKSAASSNNVKTEKSMGGDDGKSKEDTKSPKSDKNMKKDKKPSQKDTGKLTKASSRLLSTLHDNFGREENEGVEYAGAYDRKR